jgi:hypothetical protein
MTVTYSKLTQLAGALTLLASCTTQPWPAAEKLSSEPGRPAWNMAVAQKAAETAASQQQNTAALAAWMRTAQEAALLIEDKTTCGDGTISRIKVTRIYQHALGQVLALLQRETRPGGTRQITGDQGRWQLDAPPLISFSPLPALREYSTLRIGLPLAATTSSRATAPGVSTAILYFDRPSTSSTKGRATLRLLPAMGQAAARLHPAGPEIPLREPARP